MKLTITADIHDDPGLARYLEHCLASVDKGTLLKAAVYTTLQDMISYYDGNYRRLDIRFDLEPRPRLPA